MPQNQPSGRGLFLLLQRSTAVQVTSSVRLMPQVQPSGGGLPPSPTAWSPDQHHAAMLADVSRHILGRTEGRGQGFGQLCPHSHREVSEMPILFTWTLRPQCPLRRRKIVVCWAPFQSPNWVKVYVVSTVRVQTLEQQGRPSPWAQW